MITWFQSIMLGLIQGLTEFLPVSSSGHLTIFQNLFGFQNPEELILFDVLLHLGTLLAVFAVYWRDVKELAVEFVKLIVDIFRGKPNINKHPYRRLIAMLLIATVPLFAAALFSKQIESLFSSLLVVGIALIVTGTFLYFSDRLPNGTKDEKNAKYGSALFVGLVQMIAIIPGISRSGSTIVAGETVGFTRKFAVKFSFLMSIIAILGANVLQIPKAIKEPIPTGELWIYLLGMVVAAVSGFFAIKFLLKIINNGKFHIFAYYCWIAGLVAVAASFLS